MAFLLASDNLEKSAANLLIFSTFCWVIKPALKASRPITLKFVSSIAAFTMFCFSMAESSACVKSAITISFFNYPRC